MLTTKFENTLTNIVGSIKNEDFEHCGPGLLTGKSGIALFYFYYFKITKRKIYLEQGKEIIVEVFNSINKGFDLHTFCDGVGGFAWVVEHLIKNDFIEREDAPFLDDIDEFLYKKMIQDIKKGEYDFLHGAIGNGIYFINRLHKKECVGYLYEFLGELERQSIKGENGSIKWHSVCDEKGTQGCNLALAHGMASIIAFLSKTLIADINQKKTLQLLNGAVTYLLSKRLYLDEFNYSFPDTIINNSDLGMGRRVGWCYGDMGKGIALYQASKATGNIEWRTIALKTLIDTTYVRNLKDQGIQDACLCHGTAGIAHMYNRMYQDTRIESFREAATFWFEETYKMAKFEDGIAGFKAFKPEMGNKFRNEWDILNGVAGIGMTLISAISNAEYDWDECLLLS